MVREIPLSLSLIFYLKLKISTALSVVINEIEFSRLLYNSLSLTLTLSDVLFCLLFRIGSWADKFGDELWDLAQKMTKANEIKTVSLIHNSIKLIN